MLILMNMLIILAKIYMSMFKERGEVGLIHESDLFVHHGQKSTAGQHTVDRVH